MQSKIASPTRKRLFRVVAIVAIATMAGYALMLVTAKPIADGIYSNVNAEDIREMPEPLIAMPAVSDGQQLLGGRGDGLSCSIPSLLAPLFGFAPVSIQFRQACVAHDFCYRHGAATYSYTQLDCDRRLQEDAFRLCPFVYEGKSQRYCQSLARQVLLGVRLGGASSFRPHASIDMCAHDSGCAYPKPLQISTYFEYEALPQMRGEYVIARVAPVPPREGTDLLGVGLYYFIISPSAIQVRVYGIRRDGSVDRRGDLARQIRGSANFLPAPPQVLDGRFFWWRRASRTNTNGSAHFLDPLTASESDWVEALHCTQSPCAAPSDPEALYLEPMAPNQDARLVGLTTHSCGKSGGREGETCLVSIESPTLMRMWPVRAEYYGDLEHKDRYRSLAINPWLSNDGHASALYFSRRDVVYERDPSVDMTLLRAALPEPTRDGAVVPDVFVYEDWSERDEPFLMRDGEQPELLSLLRDPDAPLGPMRIHRQRAGSKGYFSACAGMGGDWLDLPPVFMDRDLATAIFRRLAVPSGEVSVASPLRLEFRKMALTDAGCELTEQASIEITQELIDSFARKDDKSNRARVLRAMAMLAGQTILSDIDGNGKIDIIVTLPQRGYGTIIRMNAL